MPSFAVDSPFPWNAVCYQAGVLLMLATAIWVGRQGARPQSWWLACGGLLLMSGVLAIGLGEDAFGCLRLFAYALFGHAAVLLLCGAIDVWRNSRVGAAWLLLSAAALELVALDAFVIEPHWLELTRVQLTSDKLRQPLRVVVLADIQTDRVGPYEREALSLALAQKPDLIAIAGDHLQEPIAERRSQLIQALRAMLLELDFRAPLGVYAVGGNADSPDWPQIFRGTEVTVLDRTQSVDVGQVRVTGLAMRDSFNTALKVAGCERFHIVVGHAPDFALGEIDADLLIAGHTHGGQVRLPFLGPILTQSRVPRAWADGVTQIGEGRTLIVSRGVGMERGFAPRLRFLCRPQIVVVDLTPLTEE